jgi:AraC-like DNA-binding protein
VNYYTIAPSPSLAPFIRCFWVLESDCSYTHRSMADGCAEMLFHYDGVFDEIKKNGTTEKSFASGLQGPTQQVSRFSTNKGFGMFGVYLYPFAIPQLFHLPASELCNQFPDTVTLLGSLGKELEEKMMLANDNCQRVKIISCFFEKQLCKQQQPHHPLFGAIREVILTNGGRSVENLAARYFLSIRQFERSFKNFAGFSPKLYARIIRFQAACNQYGNDNKTLTDIAYDCGYYDQSHFINDFKEFSGLHPKQYFSGVTEATEWRNE